MALRRAFLQKVSSSPYGPELITNGNFDVNLDNWVSQAGAFAFTWDSGKAKISGDGRGGQSFSLDGGNLTYRLKIDVTKITDTLNMFVRIGSTPGTSTYYGSAVLHDSSTIDVTFTGPASSGIAYLSLVTYSSSADCYIDNASVKKVL